ncbi:MAG TPA: hypothetical protein DCL21_03975, partial [Alphaproteobacteria bacterium]|nr:hypothetical protein [Alphaproteobacteria bacterium]
PLYGELGEQMSEIGLKEVKMKAVEKNIGERRLAQIMHQKLARVFTNNVNNDYDLYIELKPTESAIATRSDDTDQRKSISVSGNIILKDKITGEKVFDRSISRSSTYTVQDEPFATEAARTKALESIISALSGEIIQRAALWFRGYVDNENSK